MSRLAAAVCLLFTLPLVAASIEREIIVPVAGHGGQVGGRTYDTTLWVTSSSGRAAHVTLQFLRAMQTNPAPHTISFDLGPGATRVFDPIGPDVIGAPQGVGALLIRSDQPLVATARAITHVDGEPLSRAVATTFNAIPTRVAIGNGQSALAQGITFGGAAGDRSRMYVVETHEKSLAYSIALTDVGGKVLAQKLFYIAPREQRTIDLGDEFATARADHALIRVHGVNGDGRIVFVVAQIASESQDGNAYEMSYSNEPRMRMPAGEIAVYIAVAAAILAAAVIYRR